MYRIEPTSYGLKLTFSGKMSSAEAQAWLDEASTMLREAGGSFSVLVDMRDLEPLDAEAQKVFIRGQHAFLKAGMKRSAVVVRDQETRAHFERIARQSGIHANERYFSGSGDPWDREAVAWLSDESS